MRGFERYSHQLQICRLNSTGKLRRTGDRHRWGVVYGPAVPAGRIAPAYLEVLRPEVGGKCSAQPFSHHPGPFAGIVFPPLNPVVPAHPERVAHHQVAGEGLHSHTVEFAGDQPGVFRMEVAVAAAKHDQVAAHDAIRDLAASPASEPCREPMLRCPIDPRRARWSPP